MDSLKPRLIKPESTLGEQTALQLAIAWYEVGRSQGLKSRYKTPQEYAKRYVEKFIPLAINYLMEILSKPSTSKEMKDAIYDYFMERTNDTDLTNIGIPVFENPLAATHIPDTKDIRGGPLIGTSPLMKRGHKGRIEDLPIDNMFARNITGGLNG